MPAPSLPAESAPENLPSPASFLYALSNAGRGCRRRSRHFVGHVQVATQCAHAGIPTRAISSKQFLESRVRSSHLCTPFFLELRESSCCSYVSRDRVRRETPVHYFHSTASAVPTPQALARRAARYAVCASSSARQGYPTGRLLNRTLPTWPLSIR